MEDDCSLVRTSRGETPGGLLLLTISIFHFNLLYTTKCDVKSDTNSTSLFISCDLFQLIFELILVISDYRLHNKFYNAFHNSNYILKKKVGVTQTIG